MQSDWLVTGYYRTRQFIGERNIWRFGLREAFGEFYYGE